MPFLNPLSSLQLQMFMKKNTVVLKELIKHNSLNKIDKYKVYLVTNLLFELHLGGIFSHTKKHFSTLILFHQIYYFLTKHSPNFFEKNMHHRCIVL